jgi:hypothetical protein
MHPLAKTVVVALFCGAAWAGSTAILGAAQVDDPSRS